MATTAAVFFLKFTIIPKSLEDDDVTVTFSPESSYYTGQPITPDVTVKFGNIVLLRDRDYTLAPLPELMDRKKRDIMERKGDKEDENKRQKQQKESSAAAL